MNESVVFNAAAKLPKEQRPQFLEAACAGNPELRAEVEGLLEEHVPDIVPRSSLDI